MTTPKLAFPSEESMRQYRKGRFQVTCEPSKDNLRKGTFELSMTTNGSAWQTMSFYPNELEAAIKAMQSALAAIRKEGK